MSFENFRQEDNRVALSMDLRNEKRNNMRELKFRIWHTKMWHFKVGEFIQLSAFENVPIMQYTGLKDKNLVDIYEGDIVSTGEKVMRVVFINGCFYTPTEVSKYRLGGWKKGPLEVIGNIYQNPELLK